MNGDYFNGEFHSESDEIKGILYMKSGDIY